MIELPKIWYDPDFKPPNDPDDWLVFKRQQRKLEEALFAVDIATLTEAEAKEVLCWALEELERVSHYARLIENWRKWSDSPEESDDTTAAVVEALARSEIDERGHKKRRVTESNRARTPKWVEDVFARVYNEYVAEKGKPPGWSKLQGRATRLARAEGRTASELELI